MLKFIFKKIYFIVLITLLIITVIPMCSETNAQPYITGSGTEGDPYILKTAIHIDSLRYLEGAENNWFELGANIDMSTDFSNWTPIGDIIVGKWDCENFNGKGYTISNLTLDTTITSWANKHFIGLWGYVGGGGSTDGIAFLEHIKFDNFHINVTASGSGGDDLKVGIIIGEKGGQFINDIEIDSVIVTNSSLTVSYPTGASSVPQYTFGGFAGDMDNSNVRRIHVEADIEVTVVSSSAFFAPVDEGVGGILGTTKGSVEECAFVGNMSYDNTLTNMVLGLGGIVGYHNPLATTDTLLNCYAIINRMSSSYSMGGIIGYNITEANTRVRNCYVLVDTFWNQIGFSNADSTDRDGYMIGYSESTNAEWTSCYADTENVSYDFFGYLGYFNNDRTIVASQEPGAPPDSARKTTAEMGDIATFVDWDFGIEGVNVWGIDPLINEGYPYLLWRIPISLIEITHPSIGNLVFFEDSVITIDWFNNIQDTTYTDFLLYFSSNSGATWSFIDTTLNDTTYAWSVPGGIQSDDNLVMVTSLDSLHADVSDTSFTILPLPQSYTNIEIVNVIPQPMLPGGDLNVFVKSTYLDTFQLFWSYDSLTWNSIAKVIVDTVNGSIFDTTNYTWDNPSVIGSFYLRVLEIRNNQLFFDQDTNQFAGSRILAGFCYSVNITRTVEDCDGGTKDLLGSEGIHTLTAIWDPSCGWNGFAGWRLYRVKLRESLSSGLAIHTGTYTGCTHSMRSCIDGSSTCTFPLEEIYEIHDTIMDTRVRYGDDGGSEGTTVTANQRKYSLSYDPDTERYYVLVEDLLNTGVEQIYYEYTNRVNLGGFYQSGLVEDISEHRLASYVKPLSTWKSYADSSYTDGLQTVYVMKNGTTAYDDNLHNKLISRLGFNFGDYGEGYVCVGDLAGRYNTIFGSILPEPGYVIDVSEDIVLIQGATSRNFFRGIYPEAILQMRSRE